MTLKIKRALTLMELLISVIVISIMVLSLYNVELFSHQRLFNTERRSSVQNELSLVLEHISKYVTQATGDMSHPASWVDNNGLNVRIDRNAPQTPGNFNDDCVMAYKLNVGNPNTLSFSVISGNNCPPPEPNLSNKIITFTPTVHTYGTGVFDSNSVGIDLTGRFTSDAPSLKNPEVSMQTKIACNSTATN